MYYATAFFNPVLGYLTAFATNVRSFLSEAPDGMALVNAVGDAIGIVLEWIGTVLTAMLTTAGPLAPLLILFAIGIAISGILIAVKVIKSFIWGS